LNSESLQRQNERFLSSQGSFGPRSKKLSALTRNQGNKQFSFWHHRRRSCLKFQICQCSGVRRRPVYWDNEKYMAAGSGKREAGSGADAMGSQGDVRETADCQADFRVDLQANSKAGFLAIPKPDLGKMKNTPVPANPKLSDPGRRVSDPSRLKAAAQALLKNQSDPKKKAPSSLKKGPRDKKGLIKAERLPAPCGPGWLPPGRPYHR
jgi:hypothetical protein